MAICLLYGTVQSMVRRLLDRHELCAAQISCGGAFSHRGLVRHLVGEYVVWEPAVRGSVVENFYGNVENIGRRAPWHSRKHLYR